MALAPAYLTVSLRSNTGILVRALMGDGSPKISSGYGGWEVVSRPHRVGATQWKGRDPFRLTLPLLFDAWSENDLVESDINDLEMMAGRPGTRPPTVRIAGPVPRTDLEWVIETLEWGDNVIRRSSGRARQDVVVTLLQYLKDVTISEAVTRPGIPSTYTFQKGDTLQKIAARFYGDANKWSDIADYNGIRDPSTLKPGDVIRLP